MNNSENKHPISGRLVEYAKRMNNEHPDVRAKLRHGSAPLWQVVEAATCRNDAVQDGVGAADTALVANEAPSLVEIFLGRLLEPHSAASGHSIPSRASRSRPSRFTLSANRCQSSSVSSST